MHSPTLQATILFSSSSKLLSGVMSGSIDINPSSRTDDTYLPWETDSAYGGVCGTEYFSQIPRRTNTPVVFVHGNTGDATHWTPMMERFLDAGYAGEELWGITFRQASPTHAQMAAQLDAFVGRVRKYTGYENVHIVSHSLGVTGVRYWLSENDRYGWVDSFVGLAGANHGSSRCKALADQHVKFGPARSNAFLNPDNLDDPNHELAQLNENETPGDVAYYTLRATDDRFFRRNPESPRLEGAENEVVDTTHRGLLTDERAFERVRSWLEAN
jgi:triacylglycerol lipase